MPAKTPPALPGLIDAHCHLDYAPMVDDLDATFAAAGAAGVCQFVHVGCSRPKWDSAIGLADRYDRVFVALGIHPHEASQADDAALAELEQRLAHPKVVAVGETGLDFFYDHSPPEAQHLSLRRHIELARRLDLPLVLHIRDAHDAALEIVRAAGPWSDRAGMVHCFTGTGDEARRWLDLGFHLSFSGIATFKNAEGIRDAVRACPGDRILVETDAPYLAPNPVRGRPNEPAFVAFTCGHLAGIRNENPEALALQTAQNTRALLRLPEPTSATA